MGKKGDELRRLKGERVKYTFTRAELEAHDQQVRREFVDEYRKTFKAEATKVAEGMKKQVRDEWQARAEEFGGGGEDAFLAYMKYLLAAPCKVLIEQFGWAPPPKYAEGKRHRIVRFANAVIDEIEAVSADETQDIRRYAEQVRDKYGIEFLKEAEDE
jgi:hypothetical protein